MSKTIELTSGEKTMLEALWDNALACSGGDFAITEELDFRALGMSAKKGGGFITSLQNKGVISVSVSYVNDEEKVTQVEFNDHARVLGCTR